MFHTKINDYSLLSDISALIFSHINGEKNAAEQAEVLYNRLFERLNSEFVPPLDREDLLLLAQSLKSFFRLPEGYKFGEENIKLIKLIINVLPTVKNNKSFKRNLSSLREKTESLARGTVLQYEFYSDCLKVTEALERIYIKNNG